jgi:predicted Zn-dependent protease
MLARLLILLGTVAPLCAQDEVARYLQEVRVPQSPVEVQAGLRRALAVVTIEANTAAHAGEPAREAALYLRISEIQRLLHDSDAALAAARFAHALEPGDHAIALGLAAALIQNGHTEEVPALLGIDPTDGHALIRMADPMGDVVVASYLGEMAAKLLPDDPDVWDTLGTIYFRKGAWEEANAAFGAAANRAPQVAVYRYHLALSMVRCGRPDHARAELQLALECNPTDKDRASIGETLALLEPVK